MKGRGEMMRVESNQFGYLFIFLSLVPLMDWEPIYLLTFTIASSPGLVGRNGNHTRGQSDPLVLAFPQSGSESYSMEGFFFL